MTVETEALRQLIKRELPRLIEDDPELQALILNLSQGRFADRRETQDRFQQTLAELRRDRELQERKWEAQAREAEADRKAMRVFQEEQARK